MSNLQLPPKSIKSTRILDPIELGKSFDDKTFVLDVKVLLNDASVINLDFSPFPGYPEFYAMNKMMNVKKYYIYNDNFTLNVLDLSQIELATDEDKAYKMDYWAKLFKAKTWEDKSPLEKQRCKACVEGRYHCGTSGKTQWAGQYCLNFIRRNGSDINNDVI